MFEKEEQEKRIEKLEEEMKYFKRENILNAIVMSALGILVTYLILKN